MFARALLKNIMSARNHRFLAHSLFQYIDELLEPQSASIVSEPHSSEQPQSLYEQGDPTTLNNYPDTFWSWVAQFDTSDGLIPLAMATCQWEGNSIINHDSYIFMIDNFSEARTYLILENVEADKMQQASLENSLDLLQVIASRWQCVRAELEAASEYKQRDIKEAKYLDVIQQREKFIEDMKLVQRISVEISNPETIDDLHRIAVEAIREQLGFDRAAFMLLDIKKRCFSGTFGTDENGKTVELQHTQYDLHQLEEAYINALFEGQDGLVVLEDAPLYNDGAVIGQGWNGMLILRDGDDIIGWVALDNYINRSPITS
ncbi:hypothetical protein RJD39_17105 [Vibrio scophthalmi]